MARTHPSSCFLGNCKRISTGITWVYAPKDPKNWVFRGLSWHISWEVSYWLRIFFSIHIRKIILKIWSTLFFFTIKKLVKILILSIWLYFDIDNIDIKFWLIFRSLFQTVCLFIKTLATPIRHTQHFRSKKSKFFNFLAYASTLACSVLVN